MQESFIAGKGCVITGVSSGIGLELVHQLTAHGVVVTGWGRHAPEFEHPLFRFIRCDVRDEGNVAAAATETILNTPETALLICNSGYGVFNLAEALTPDQFRGMVDTNLTGAFLVSRALIPHFKALKSGHIVFVASTAGKNGAAYGSGYNASKFGVTGLAECLFQELRKDGIKVSTVFPGSTETRFFDEIPTMKARKGKLSTQEVAASIFHILNTAPNCLIRELEIRPLNMA